MSIKSDNKDTDRVDYLHSIVKDLIKNKAPENEILNRLLKEGLDQNYALTIIENVKSDIDDSKEFRRLLGMGIFFVVGGLAINYFSYKIAENFNSGFFYLFWGIVAVGIVLIIRAFILYKK